MRKVCQNCENKFVFELIELYFLLRKHIEISKNVLDNVFNTDCSHQDNGRILLYAGVTRARRGIPNFLETGAPK